MVTPIKGREFSQNFFLLWIQSKKERKLKEAVIPQYGRTFRNTSSEFSKLIIRNAPNESEKMCGEIIFDEISVENNFA